MKRFGDRFIERIYTDSEKTKAERRASPAASYAQGWAAKEACAKALGTGFRQGVFWRDLVVANYPSGQPYMVLSGGAKARLESLVPQGMEPRVDLSQLAFEGFVLDPLLGRVAKHLERCRCGRVAGTRAGRRAASRVGA